MKRSHPKGQFGSATGKFYMVEPTPIVHSVYVPSYMFSSFCSQCWYWERVIIEDSTYGVKYDKTIKPRMLLWTEKNSKARMNVFIKKGVDFGTVSFQTYHQYDVVLTRTF
jgi:hypothetical protein